MELESGLQGSSGAKVSTYPYLILETSNQIPALRIQTVKNRKGSFPRQQRTGARKGQF